MLRCGGMANYDVIIIGGGLSGLTSAALLSKAGLGVCVLEEQPRPGGYLQGFSRGGFEFDTAIHWLNGMAPGGMSGRLLEYLGGDYPVCPPLKQFQRYKGQNHDYLLTTEPGLMRDAMAADFPAQAEGIHRLFADAEELGRRMSKLHRLSRAFETMPPWTKMFRGLGMLFWYLGIRRHLRPELEQGLARYVDDPAFARIYIAEEKLSTVLVPMAWAYQGDLYAPPQGGSLRLIEWLVNRGQKQGAEIILKECVEEVLLEGGRAVGVRCASGRVAKAPHVVCASDVSQLYNRLLPSEATTQKFRSRLQEADLFYSSLSLYLGLDCDPRELGLGEEQVLLTRDDVPRAEQMCNTPDRVALTVLAPSVRDPSLAPAGKGTVTIHCPALLEDHHRWGTGDAMERGERYKEIKQRQAQILLDRVDRELCPGLSRKVTMMEAATPVTFKRYTRNRGGSLLGTKASDRNIKARVAHYITPVKGLLLAGHWAEYSGGVPMAIKAAANTSLILLREINRKAFKELCGAMDA